jgi:hypothetical protein
MDGAAIPSLSCIQCAKRKVRCDRSNPCSNCRRRKGDVCEYPLPQLKRSSIFLNEDSERLQKLEQYVRSLGHDPDQIGRNSNSGSSYPSESPHAKSPSNHQNKQRGTKRTYQDPTWRKDVAVRESSPKGRKHARLVEHGKQTTYIEA